MAFLVVSQAFCLGTLPFWEAISLHDRSTIGPCGFYPFAAIHVYLVFYHDYVEGRGEISSMGGGWKFIEEEFFKKE